MRTKTLVLMAAMISSLAAADDRPTVHAMRDELARTMDKLELPGTGKPYYVSYQLTDLDRASVHSSLGALVASEDSRHRTLDIDLRVGSNAFDNSNVADRDLRRRTVTLPLDDDYASVRRDLWLATDRVFKTAAETLERKRAVVAAEVKGSDDAASFSKEPATHIVDAHEPPAVDRPKLEALATRLSAVFRTNPDVYAGSVSIDAASGRQYFVSSEGSEDEQPVAFVKLDIECSTQAADGMPVHDSITMLVRSIDELPADTELVARVGALSRELSALRSAPVVDDYAGPVVLEGVAAGEMVRATLAENFAGTPGERSDRAGAGRATDTELVGRIDQRILPAGTTIVDDPTTTRVAGQIVVGGVHFDEEGIAAQKVSLVENGVFKRFLMSRIPRKGFEHSNGHGASTQSLAVGAHPMNLIVRSTHAVADAELRRRALAAAKEEGLAYILVVDKLDTITRPTVMKRVYPDGREELVRGASLGPIPLRNLRDILAIGATPTVYSYFGEGRFAGMFDGSGGYLVSIIAPTILLRDVDVKKPTGSQPSVPIAPRPKD
jgi:TldD protein